MRFPDPLRASRLDPLWAALVATLVALLFLALLPASSRGNDSADFTEFYRPVALSLLAGDGFVVNGAPAARYPPGFPVAVAAALGAGRLAGFPEETSLRLLALLGFALTAAALCRLGRLCFGPGVGLLAAAAFALYPPHLFLVKQPNSELIFLPLLLFGLELAWRARPGRWAFALAAGVVFGYAALVRPIALLIAAPVGLFLLVSAVPGIRAPRRLLLAAALAAGQLLTVAPWVLHLHQQLGSWVPLSTGGRLSMLDGLTIAAKKDRPAPPMPAPVAALMREIDAARPALKTPGAIFAFLGAKARSEPGAVAGLVWVKLRRSFYATDSMQNEGLLLAIQLPFLLLAAGATAAAWRRPSPWRPLAALALLLLLYFLAMTVLVLSILRYVVPAFALFVLLLAAFAAELLPALLTRRRLRGSASPGAPS